LELERILRASAAQAVQTLESPFLRSEAITGAVLAQHVARIEAESEEAIFEAAQRSRSRSWVAMFVMLLGWKRERARAAPPRDSTRAEVDRMRARAAAKSLSAVVGGMMVAGLFSGENKKDSAAKLLRKGPGLAKSRIATIATTETAVTVSDEVRVSAEVVVQMGPYRTPGTVANDVIPSAGITATELVYEWSAILDGAACKFCLGMHGERTETASFANGSWPPAHPRCRCAAIPLLIARKRAA
jgi:hypothetical protein